MTEKDSLSITLTAEQALDVKSILHAVGKTFRHYTGMNTGKSEVHNLYPSDLELCFNIADAIGSKLEQKSLAEMVSQHCYDEICAKLKKQVGEEAFEYVFPAVKKALEEGSGNVREEILINWLDVDSCRVCSRCGAIMEEGWYLDCQGYACSDECAMYIMSVPTKALFERYRIYKEDIDQYLEDEGEGRKEEDLTQEEIDEIIDIVSEGMDACYTEWN